MNSRCVVAECTNAVLLGHAESLTREYVDSWYADGEAYRDGDVKLFAEFNERFDGRHGVAWVALEGGTPVGSVLLSQLGEDAVELMKLYVRPASRGFGFGTALVSAALDWASHADRVVKLIVEGSRKDAQAIYVGVGFEKDLTACCPDDFTAYVWVPSMVPPAL